MPTTHTSPSMGDDSEYKSAFVQEDDGALMAQIKALEDRVTPLLKQTGGNPVDALRMTLQDPPYATRTDSVKIAASDLVSKAMGQIKEDAMDGALAALSLEECDVLMKYIYRALSAPGKDQTQYTMLLKWHPAVLKRAGPGSIVRAFTEVQQPL